MTTFAELDLIEPLQRAVAQEEYTTPTPIQAQTIPEALKGRDILGCAQTGTGKTAAFALPILNYFGKNPRKAIVGRPLALILAPTRELAIQIGESFAVYGRNVKVHTAVIYGGVNQAGQVRSLERGLHIVVATPGRLLDLMQQGHVRLDKLEIFVLDEADRMLDMGFLPDLKRIIATLPTRRQSMFFSATLPPAITQLSKQLLSNPVSISVTPQSSTVELISQSVMFVERKQKLGQLLRVLNSGTVGQALVFTQTKRGANMLAQQLSRNGIEALAIHGNKSQNARQRALDEFKSEKISVLVATDLAARGIDIESITHVINYELPKEPESYVHRIGRTGRAGESGIALSLVDSSERGLLQSIQRLIGKSVPVQQAPILEKGRSPEKIAREDSFGDGVPMEETPRASRPARTDSPRTPKPRTASASDTPQRPRRSASASSGARRSESRGSETRDSESRRSDSRRAEQRPTESREVKPRTEQSRRPENGEQRRSTARRSDSARPAEARGRGDSRNTESAGTQSPRTEHRRSSVGAAGSDSRSTDAVSSGRPRRRRFGRARND